MLMANEAVLALHQAIQAERTKRLETLRSIRDGAGGSRRRFVPSACGGTARRGGAGEG
jgi:hypothetical protein